ncbi:MAG: hypothetical protein MK110_04370 [Fuerstiella sp.]|nr:hypothetical protein [Fuerstiella sp.]
MSKPIRQNRKEIRIPGVVAVLTAVDCTRYQLTPGGFRALVATRYAGVRSDDLPISIAASEGTSQGEPLQRNSALKCPGLVAVVTATAVVKPEHFCCACL